MSCTLLSVVTDVMTDVIIIVSSNQTVFLKLVKIIFEMWKCNLIFKIKNPTRDQQQKLQHTQINIKNE